MSVLPQMKYVCLYIVYDSIHAIFPLFLECWCVSESTRTTRLAFMFYSVWYMYSH